MATSVVLINKRTGDIYRHKTGTSFVNITTGKEGELTPAAVKGNLVLPIKLNDLAEKNPHLLTLIEALQLRVYIDETSQKA